MRMWRGYFKSSRRALIDSMCGVRGVIYHVMSRNLLIFGVHALETKGIVGVNNRCLHWAWEAQLGVLVAYNHASKTAFYFFAIQDNGVTQKRSSCTCRASRPRERAYEEARKLESASRIDQSGPTRPPVALANAPPGWAQMPRPHISPVDLRLD
jgi:hypothetical protein